MTFDELYKYLSECVQDFLLASFSGFFPPSLPPFSSLSFSFSPSTTFSLFFSLLLPLSLCHRFPIRADTSNH